MHSKFNLLYVTNVLILHRFLPPQYPDKFILFTEACTGSYPWELQKVAQVAKYQKNRKRQWCQMLQLDNDDQVLLGSWERGQEYTNDIIENLNHWSTGWTDWNLVLDMNGGDRFDFGSLAILQTMDTTMMLTRS